MLKSTIKSESLKASLYSDCSINSLSEKFLVANPCDYLEHKNMEQLTEDPKLFDEIYEGLKTVPFTVGSG